MKKIFVLLIALLLFIGLTSCDSPIVQKIINSGSFSKTEDLVEPEPLAPTGDPSDCDYPGYYPVEPGYDPGYYPVEPGYYPAGKDGYYDEGWSWGGRTDFYDGYQYQSGTLSAKAIFDNDDYDYFQSLIVKGQEEDGAFYRYQQSFNLNLIRVELNINNGALAYVELLDDKNDTEFATYADRNGKCYLFTSRPQEKYNVKINGEPFEVTNGIELTIENNPVAQEGIQVMFVIDTTGSMGDEIRYLQVELQDVINRISSNNQVDVEVALMFYRDLGDEYVTRYFDFTTDIAEQVKNLGNQSANGGGDFEEAVYKALGEAAEANWANGPKTKILVHVADAPSHDYDVAAWFKAVKSLADQGVRIINVASSGIDKKTEYFFRTECIQTNGCYAPLTNHSGIGGSHIDPEESEEAVVECLNDLLVRVIDGMHTGTYGDPKEYQVNNQEILVKELLGYDIKSEEVKQVLLETAGIAVAPLSYGQLYTSQSEKDIKTVLGILDCKATEIKEGYLIAGGSYIKYIIEAEEQTYEILLNNSVLQIQIIMDDEVVGSKNYLVSNKITPDALNEASKCYFFTNMPDALEVVKVTGDEKEELYGEFKLGSIYFVETKVEYPITVQPVYVIHARTTISLWSDTVFYLDGNYYEIVGDYNFSVLGIQDYFSE